MNKASVPRCLPAAHTASVLLSDCLLGQRGWWLPANAVVFGRGVGRDGAANRTLHKRDTGLKETLSLTEWKIKTSTCHPGEERVA